MTQKTGQFKVPKKTTTWRTCPNCGSRATKLYSLNTGKYTCQICKHQYTFGTPDALLFLNEPDDPLFVFSAG